jgi:nondiscriminating aspartyl-tRNA synthetase
MERTHYTESIDESLIGKEVTIAGWIEDIRELGAITFLTVRDVTSSIQVIAKPELLIHNDVKITRQSAVSVTGIVQRSRSKNYPVEINANRIKLFSLAKHPLPIDPTGRVKASLDARLDARALDLRNPSVAAIFKLRHHVLQCIRSTLVSRGFIEVNTPKIIGSASEGGANLFKLSYFNRQAYLAQSPQLYKEQLTLALDKVFEIAHYYRAEKSHTTRHLNEFVSVDIEAAYMDADDVMSIAEDVIIDVISYVKKRCSKELELVNNANINVPSKPFPRITYEHVIDILKKDHGIDIEFGDDLSDHTLKLLGEKFNGFYFIVDWPLRLKPFYIHEKDDKRLSYSFDLQYGALELASGGKRLHDADKLRARIIEQGLNVEEFKDHLKVFDYGMPPHAGWGLGLDRLMTVICKVNNVREVVLYPRDTDRLSP